MPATKKKTEAQPAALTVSINARSLVCILSDALPFAGTGDRLPALCAVKLELRGSTLHAFATDRYRLAHARTHLSTVTESGQTADFLLSSQDAKTILKVFRPARKDLYDLTLSFDGDKLTIRRTGSLDVLPELTMTCQAVDGGKPIGYRDLIDKCEPEPVGSYSLNPDFLADFAKVSHSVGQPMRIEPCGDNKPIRVTIGEHFVGIIMPVRAAS